MSSLESGPTSHTYFSQRLRLHYVDWGNEGAPPLLLVHGTRDHCRNWDWVARALRDRYHVIAPDLRGHGDSEWVHGSTYTFADYIYDIAQLVHQRQLAPLRIIGHSLGGNICLQYTGVFPGRVHKVVSIEGLGPPPNVARARADRPIHERYRQWIESQRQLAGRLPRRYASLDEAAIRMKSANRRLSDEHAWHLTLHGMHQNEDGSFSWKFDNYVRVFSPYRGQISEARELWAQIDCPVLLVRGAESWVSDPEMDGRVGAFRDARVVTLEKAGHWAHHDQLDAFLEHVTAFL